MCKARLLSSRWQGLSPGTHRACHRIILVAVQELYTPFYDATMPLLKHILASAKDKTQRRLCGKALECISLIAMSVGRDTFQKDAQDFMLYLRQLNTMDMDSDNPLLTYVQSAGTRMCKCLGADFLPMLPDFVPPLIRSAGKKSTFQVRHPGHAPALYQHRSGTC